jgi:hypothetical protein
MISWKPADHDGNRLDESGLVFSSSFKMTLIRVKGLNEMGPEGGVGDGVE